MGVFNYNVKIKLKVAFILMTANSNLEVNTVI